MKKIVLFISLLMAVLAFAEGNVEFQAFSGKKNMLKIGNAKGGLHPFMFQAKGQGWAFQAQGQVAAPNGDAGLLLDSYLDGEVTFVVAYIPSKAAGTNGKDYEVGMFDGRLYMEDEALDTRGVKFKLLPPANDDWATGMAAEAASTGATLAGTLWDGSHDVEITRTAAVPLDSEALNPPPPKPKPAPAPVPVVKKEEPKPAPVVKKRVVKEPEEEEPPVKKRVVKKRRVVEDDEEEEPPVRKRKVVKKKRYVEDDEEEEPVVRKKKVVKKRRVVVEEDDEDEDEGLSIREKRRRALSRKNAAQYED